MPLKTLFLNPPSFENFDGGASSRWPATREIESYWYPVWLAYPAGMLEGSKLLDAPPHHVSAAETIKMTKDFDFLVLFTSTPGFKELFLGNSPKPRLSIGIGVNWVSPFGPLRLDLAKAILKQEGDETKLFSFNVGTSF